VDRPPRDSITGLILAGGRGSRMGGVDKGLVPFEGRPLAAHVLARLVVQVGQVLVSANRNAAQYAQFGLEVLADPAELAPYSGPLAGLLAACRAARTPWLAVVPCDVPRLPLDLVARLGAGLGSARAALAVAGGHRQPLCALIDVAHSLARDERRVAVWLDRIGAAEVVFDESSAFANLNSLDELDGAGPATQR
jgi:molybdenum cofactor guanylyltransferase